MYIGGHHSLFHAFTPLVLQEDGEGDEEYGEDDYGEEVGAACAADLFCPLPSMCFSRAGWVRRCMSQEECTCT